MEDECSWVVGLRVTWNSREVGLAGTRNSREVGWPNHTSKEKSVWATTTSALFKPLVSVADTQGNFAEIFSVAHTFKYDYLRKSRIIYFFLHEPSKDVIRMRHVNMFDEEQLLNDILQLIGFSKLSSLRCFNIDPSLITALVERWRPETHTFHLPHGEFTITLEDMSLQLGVNVNGLPIVGPTYFDWNEIYEELLGKVLGDEQDMRG
ncbi:hypothetical protein Lal_00038153 [Lupinus albus]|nr:hypothetical protein Lal_00038153 [Lupinus albus]